MNFEKLPKIELHCHLDGSVRPETIIELAKIEGVDLPTSNIEKIKNILIAPMECTSLNEYLERFQVPVAIMQSKESLKRVAYELMEDSAKENIKYIEIRFAPLLHTNKGLTSEDIIQSVLEGIKEGEKNYDIKGNLILSFLRHMPAETIYEVIEIGKKYLGQGVVAIDLCASEEKGFCEKFIKPFLLGKNYGYRVTIHAGETGIGENVFDAIQTLGAERIGHGIHIKNCKEAYELVKEKNIFLEMCPTSNVQTKAVNSFDAHPILDFHRDGIKVTINTDNRTVSNTTLTNEYHVIKENFEIDLDTYKNIYFNSVDAAFTDCQTKEKLKNLLKELD
ncbi:adenosine deaminase [Cetobacterium sp. 2G large]|uniref:adenosine deaminase n=1 Tax=Cetobacterium sp. 2G large TaxID=2759680 RepID=UPI00163D051D|nr:adenosine deaminase [Cetobacterium sp. 2G large]MBC2852376.1 adenosine deaminase [Cetobacterium sp. 2G large]